jgi:hypothetical protein
MSLVVTTVVDSTYMAYLPAFVYCMNRAYPHYHVRLFMRDKCPYNLKAWKLNAELVPMFEDFPRYRYMSIALRFAIEKKHFVDFDYAYITDIDMMIMPESKDIEYFHITEMLQTGLCYSNSLRNANHYEGSLSLSGLHFASKEWFERSDEIAGQYREWMRKGLVGMYREYDGVMLYRIAEQAKIGLPGKYKLAKRHHGIHMGNFRLFPGQKLKLEVRIPPEFRSVWMQHQSNRIFREICEACRKDNAEFDSQLTDLDNFIAGRI